MDQDLEATNELIEMLQQPVPPPALGAMEGDQDDARSMVDDTEALPLDRMDEGSLAASAASGGGCSLDVDRLVFILIRVA
jgi:hypothetical protein